MNKAGIVTRPAEQSRLDVGDVVIGYDMVIDTVVFDIQCLFDESTWLEAIRIDQRANELAILLFKLSERGTR